MIVFDGDTRRALAAAGLTQSDNDGEAVNALRAVQRFLKGQGLTIKEVMEKALVVSEVENPFGPGSNGPAPREWEQCVTKPWQRDALYILKCSPLELDEKERAFLASMRRMPRRPTEKQQGWLDSLSAQAEAIREAA